MEFEGRRKDEILHHVPVMVKEVLALLDPKPGEVILDGTIGAGGHAGGILKRIERRGPGPPGVLIGIDRDEEVLPIAREVLREHLDRVKLYTADFRDAREVLERAGFTRADGVLLDLGPSSFQLDNSERGFSFQEDGPLDMRMDRSSRRTAADLVNGLGEKELSRLIYQYSDERFAGRLAREICIWRKGRPIRTTRELATIAENVLGRKRGRIHPATRLFLALRIAVNEELESLRKVLEGLPQLLTSGGRVVIISFHSLEDRLVKKAFADGKSQGYYEVLTRKPLSPSRDEVLRNPRSRSAKLRAAKHIC